MGRGGAFGVAFAAACLALACSPPLSRVIYRTYSDLWPPAQAEKALGFVNGLQNFHTVAGAVKLGVFEVLAQSETGSLTAEDVARATNSSVRGTAALLDALCALDLARTTTTTTKKTRDDVVEVRYALGTTARAFFVRGSDSFLGGLMLGVLGKQAEDYALMDEAVARGGADPATSHDQIANKAGANDDAFWTDFAESTVEFQRGAARGLAKLVRSSLGATLFEDARVLDVACGSGIFGFEIARLDPTVHVDALDQSSVLPTTRRWARHFGVDAQMKYLEGSAFDVVLEKDAYDVVLCSHFLHHFDAATNAALLLRLALALQPDTGRLFVNDFVRPAAPYSPWRLSGPAPYLFDITMLVGTEQGHVFSLEELDAVFANASLHRLHVASNFPMPYTFITAARNKLLSSSSSSSSSSSA